MTLISDFISLFYPVKCAACNIPLFLHENEICNRCFLSLPKTDYQSQRGNRIEQIFWGRVQIHSATSFWFFHKGSRIQRLLHNLKYKGRTGAGLIAGEWFGNALKSEVCFSSCDFIIPVPLHKKRQMSRGYNQCQSIAEGLSRSLSIPVKTNFLIRSEYSSSQTREAKFSRWQKVQNLFFCTDLNALTNRHILLVDDVITTGATLEACCLALQKAEGIKISVISLAFAE